MIAKRIWHAYTKPENADAYEAMLKPEVLPGISTRKGYRGEPFSAARRVVPKWSSLPSCFGSRWKSCGIWPVPIMKWRSFRRSGARCYLVLMSGPVTMR